VALVVLLRGVNVGGHRIFRPAALAKQLRHLLNLYQDDLPLALAAYNAGVHRVKNRKVPRIRETRTYVRKVLRNYEMFRSHQKPSPNKDKK